MAKRIDASDETEQGAENAAMQFAGESRDQKSFEAYYEKNLKPKGLQKYFSPPLGEHSYEINGVGVSRAFVRKVFEADRGDVLQPERIGDNYVVAVIADVNKKGTASVAGARSSAEPAIRNKKKAELIRKKLGNFNTLEDVTTLMGAPVQSLDSVRFSSQENRPLSFETKVLGATFNPANKGKLVKEVLESRYGSVYVIRVDNVTTTPLENADITAQRKSLEMRGRMNILFSSQFAQYGQQQYDPAAVLRKAANIKDYRTKFNY
jgi:peptidyl-prolyl cis-trans isomerase D